MPLQITAHHHILFLFSLVEMLVFNNFFLFNSFHTSSLYAHLKIHYSARDCFCCGIDLITTKWQNWLNNNVSLKLCILNLLNLAKNFTAWKLAVFGVILVRIFPYSDWIRRDTMDQNNSNFEYEHFLPSVWSNFTRHDRYMRNKS